MTTETQTLEIRCAKPGCFWTGSPADAPGHTCPTPAPAGNDSGPGPESSSNLGHPFAGITDASGEPIPGEIDADAEPTTPDELELWLNEHGQYSELGVPLDEKTARLDALYGETRQERPPEPEIPRDAPSGLATDVEEPALAGSGELVQAPPPETPAEGPRPWQVAIAAELENQTDVDSMRWLVVLDPADPDTEEATLIGRGRIKKDAQEILDKVVEGGTIPAANLRIEKTSAVLGAWVDAEVLEPATGLGSDTAVEPGAGSDSAPSDEEPKPEPEPEPELEPETTVADTIEAAKEAQDGRDTAGDERGGQRTLIDRDAYLSEELALPQVDGHGIDRISVGFSGRIMLDRSDKTDVAIYRDLELGKEVELRVAGRVSGTGAKGATNKDGDLDVIVGEKTILVNTVYVLRPEEL